MMICIPTKFQTGFTLKGVKIYPDLTIKVRVGLALAEALTITHITTCFRLVKTQGVGMIIITSTFLIYNNMIIM